MSNYYNSSYKKGDGKRASAALRKAKKDKKYTDSYYDFSESLGDGSDGDDRLRTMLNNSEEFRKEYYGKK
jgi:hypothetical protein